MILALVTIASTILVILGVRALLDWLCKLVELHDACSGRDPLVLTEADMLDPRIAKILGQAPHPLGAANCSRGGESHVRTAPAASLISFHGRTNKPRGRRDHV